MFVVLEGIDACGKSTQAELLKKRMNAKLFKFPDVETPVGKLIYAHLNREWRAEPDADGMTNALVFQALQLANQMEHADTIAWTKKMMVNAVADRWWPSGVVYGAEDGLDSRQLVVMHAYLPKADIHILLDAEPSVSAERRPERRDRYEQQPGLMEKVVKRYRWFWKRMAEQEIHGKQTWPIVNADAEVGQVHKAIMEAVRAVQAKIS